ECLCRRLCQRWLRRRERRKELWEFPLEWKPPITLLPVASLFLLLGSISDLAHYCLMGKSRRAPPCSVRKIVYGAGRKRGCSLRQFSQIDNNGQQRKNEKNPRAANSRPMPWRPETPFARLAKMLLPVLARTAPAYRAKLPAPADHRDRGTLFRTGSRRSLLRYPRFSCLRAPPGSDWSFSPNPEWSPRQAARASAASSEVCIIAA